MSEVYLPVIVEREREHGTVLVRITGKWQDQFIVVDKTVIRAAQPGLSEGQVREGERAMNEMSLLIKLYERSKSVVLEGSPAIEFLLDSGEIVSLAHNYATSQASPQPSEGQAQLRLEARKLAEWFVSKWDAMDIAGIYDRFGAFELAHRIISLAASQATPQEPPREQEPNAERVEALKEFLAPRLNNQDFWFALKVAFGVTASNAAPAPQVERPATVSSTQPKKETL